jgi:PmbA protein
MKKDIIAEKVLSLAKRRAEGCEVLYEESVEAPITFRANKLFSLETKFTTGLGLRIVKNGRIGFACTTDPGKAKELVDNAVASARFGQAAKFTLPRKAEKKAEVKVLSPEVKKAKNEALVEAGRKTIAPLVREIPEIQCELVHKRSTSRVRLLNSSGLDRRWEATASSFFVEGLVVAEDGLMWVLDAKTSRKLVIPSPKTAAKLALRVRQARKVVSLPGKPLPVFFAAEAMPNLWYAFIMGVNGKNAQKGASPLLGKIGERLLDERLTLWDDPTLDWGPDSAPWDDEGVASRRNVLFEQGVFKGFLYDLQTAGLMGTQSTGNARRSYSTQPFPSATNFVVKSGKDKSGDLLKGIKEGVIVYTVIGGGQSNLLAGDFSLNIGLGYKIENGKIAGRVKDVMVAGNVYSLFKDNLLALSKEAEWAGNIKTPSVLFKDVSLASGKK